MLPQGRDLEEEVMVVGINIVCQRDKTRGSEPTQVSSGGASQHEESFYAVANLVDGQAGNAKISVEGERGLTPITVTTRG